MNNFEIGQQYFDLENGVVITITAIWEDNILVGNLKGKHIRYSRPRYDGKITDGWSFAGNSAFAKNLIPVFETVNM